MSKPGKRPNVTYMAPSTAPAMRLVELLSASDTRLWPTADASGPTNRTEPRKSNARRMTRRLPVDPHGRKVTLVVMSDFDGLIDEWMNDEFEKSPVRATQLGIDGHDAQLGDFSAARFARNEQD